MKSRCAIPKSCRIVNSLEHQTHDTRYAAKWFKSCPLEDWGHPQTRPRLYCALFRADLFGPWLTIAKFWEVADELWTVFLTGHSRHPVDMFLLPEHDVDVAAQRAEDWSAVLQLRQGIMSSSAAQSFMRQRWPAKLFEAQAKWRFKHAAAAAMCYRSLFLDSEHGELFPAYCLLPERCKDLLGFLEVSYPETRPLLISMAQSAPTVAHNFAHTIVPGILLWLGHRGRLALGRELMSLQGLYYVNGDAICDNDCLLADLAGNAFCVPACAAMELFIFFACFVAKGCS